ncbi:MAG: Uroporphyrinogen decarboxylase family protein [Parcubacteria group bacterium GW2011_GWF2_45_11]|nr:MAG: Uroporphyrinogen decarboxylase family protein [Parcubacteria group bacterium GW2011_GWF2_45_11]
MKPKERVLNALNFEKSDRIPIDLHNFLVCAKLTGKPFGEVFHSSSLIAQSQLDAHKIFDHDMLLIEAGVATLAESCGAELEYPADTSPWVKTHPFAELNHREIKAALRNMEVPDPAASLPLKIMVEAVKIILDEKGDELFIMGRADQGPFSLAGELRGINEFLLDLAVGAEYIEDLLRFTSEVYFSYADAMMRAGSHGTSMGESLAGPDVISPEFYKKYAMKYEKEVISKLKAKGYIISNHICGNVDAILDDLIGTGANIIEIDGKTNLKSACQKAKGKTCIMGSVNPNVFAHGTVQDVRDKTIETIEAMKGNYGFILGPGCALGGDVALENIKAFVETGKESGKY